MPTLRQLPELAPSSGAKLIVSVCCGGVYIRVNGFRSRINGLRCKKRLEYKCVSHQLATNLCQ